MEFFLISKIEELAFIRVEKNDSLWNSKVLDSISIVELVTEIEIEYSISIPFNEIIVDNFETINLIMNYIASKNERKGC
jgi:acyl carrier protein